MQNADDDDDDDFNDMIMRMRIIIMIMMIMMIYDDEEKEDDDGTHCKKISMALTWIPEWSPFSVFVIQPLAYLMTTMLLIMQEWSRL